MSSARTLRLAVAQSAVPEDPTEPATLRESGAGIRDLMREAAAAGARLVQFPEGAVTYPGKHVMSSGPPGVLAASDWSRVPWDVLREETEAIARLAGERSPAVGACVMPLMTSPVLFGWSMRCRGIPRTPSSGSCHGWLR